EIILKNVIKKESIKLSKKQIKDVILKSQGDARRLIHMLEQIHINKLTDDISTRSIINTFDTKIIYRDLHDNFTYLLESEYGIKNCINIFYAEPRTVPLMVHANYQYILDNRCLDECANIADYLSEWDVVEHYRRMNPIMGEFFIDYAGVLCTAGPKSEWTYSKYKSKKLDPTTYKTSQEYGIENTLKAQKRNLKNIAMFAPLLTDYDTIYIHLSNLKLLELLVSDSEDDKIQACKYIDILLVGRKNKTGQDCINILESMSKLHDSINGNVVINKEFKKMIKRKRFKEQIIELFETHKTQAKGLKFTDKTKPQKTINFFKPIPKKIKVV
ncbi:unnamed protein product, partial [marine sediment metagenome]